MLEIDSSSCLVLNGRRTGLVVTQSPVATVVYTPQKLIAGQSYMRHEMPHKLYDLVDEAGRPGCPGRGQFEADLLTLLKRIAPDQWA